MVMEIWEIIFDIIDLIVLIIGFILGSLGSIYSWHQRKVELKSKLYYPLFIACYNLLLIFDEIKTYKNNEEQGVELYNAAAKHLDDIMNSYGTITNLKSETNDPEKDYFNMFFKVKRIVDLNQKSINNNWPEATIWFENGKQKTFTGDDSIRLSKIDDFNCLYNKLLKLKELCERGDKILKRGQKL